MTTSAALVEMYGPLMTLDDLATLLRRNKAGLRQSLSREAEWTTAINASRKKFGRRVYYRTADIARLIGDGVDCGHS
ncbi:MAG: DNA-binding protein [Rhodocyclaceae bacterium]|nr:DNA-binding protein [Rhodocyclaceae bacterium]